FGQGSDKGLVCRYGIDFSLNIVIIPSNSILNVLQLSDGIFNNFSVLHNFGCLSYRIPSMRSWRSASEHFNCFFQVLYLMIALFFLKFSACSNMSLYTSSLSTGGYPCSSKRSINPAFKADLISSRLLQSGNLACESTKSL